MAKTPKTEDNPKPDDSQAAPDAQDPPETAEDPATDPDTGESPPAQDPPDAGDSVGVDMSATPDAPEAPAATEIASAVPPPPPVPEPRRGGMSVVLGGVIAAVLGAGAMYLATAQDWIAPGGPDTELLARIDALESSLAAAETALDESEGEIAALKAAEPDLSAVNAAIAANTGATEAVSTAAEANATAIAALTERLNGTDERLQKVAVQQIPEAELPKAISDAYDAKLADLLATIDGRFATMQAGLDEKVTEIETTQAAAADAEAAALAAARLSEARAAFARIRTSLEDGTPFADEVATVADLTGADIPAPLADTAAEGVPTVEALAQAFPAAARNALKVSAATAVEDGSLSRFQAFLRTQAGARSLTPREGDHPDAVLSRAEAATARGDLDAAVAELQALPEEGQAAMADWLALAETRRAALAAADGLAAQFEQD